MVGYLFPNKEMLLEGHDLNKVRVDETFNLAILISSCSKEKRTSLSGLPLIINNKYSGMMFFENLPSYE